MKIASMYLLLLPLFLFGQRLPKKQAVLNLQFDTQLASDTLRLQVEQKPIGGLSQMNFVKWAAAAVNQDDLNHQLTIPTPEAFHYFSISRERSLSNAFPYVFVLEDYLLEPGDSVFIRVSRDTSYHPEKHLIKTISGLSLPEMDWDGSKYIRAYQLDFSGKGSLKFSVRFELDRLLKRHFDYEYLLLKGRFLLDSNKKALGDRIYGILLTDYLAKLFMRFKNSGNEKLWKDAAELDSGISAQIKQDAKFYAGWQLAWFEHSNRSLAVADRLQGLIKAYPSGLLRDRMLTRFLYLYKEVLDEGTFQAALQMVGDRLYYDQLLKMSGNLSRGSRAFDFALPDRQGKIVRLSELKGKVVFMDFYFNGCGGCAEYYGSVVSRVKEHFKGDEQVVFVSVSIDKTREVWLEGIASKKYTSQDAINLYTAGLGSAHPIIKHYMIAGYPTPLLIDGAGLIYNADIKDLRLAGPGGLIRQINQAKSETRY